MVDAGRLRRWTAEATLALVIVACLGACKDSGAPTSADDTGVSPTVQKHDGRRAVVRGEPIDVATLEGKILFDDFEDVLVMQADGTHVRRLVHRAGPEFDGAWAPDGRRIVYRDSRRGIKTNDDM